MFPFINNELAFTEAATIDPVSLTRNPGLLNPKSDVSCF
jgi:hypothetical protein